MSAPCLNRALLLERRIEQPDGAGGLRLTWETLGTLWAEVRNFSGRESGELGIAKSRIGMKIKVRAMPHGSDMRPSPAQRFREGTRSYKITAVVEAEPVGKYLVCYANEEVVA